jgi:hypothetical protein
MDEKKIAEMFREALPDPPPASFTHDDVRLVSNRQRLRRNRLVAGSALGVILVFGGVTTGLLLSDGSSSPDGVAAAQSGTTSNDDGVPYDAHVPGQEGREPAPRQAAPSASVKDFPTQPPKQGGTASGEAGPGAGSTPTGCPKADGELAAALASELPSAAGKQATRTPLQCPNGVRGASFSLRDGNQPPGVVSILLIPKGVVLPSTPPWANSPPGTSVKTAYGSKGGEIVLVSQPPEGSTKAPFDGQLAAAAKHIAAKY